MENNDLLLLLKFAQAIQQKIKIETDENAKKSLEKDLLKIKDEIGKKVLDLPNEVSIFPPFESSQIIDEKYFDQSKEPISSINYYEYPPSQKSKDSLTVSPINSPVRSQQPSKIQSISNFVDDNNQDSSLIEETSIRPFPDQNSSIGNSANDLAAKFNQFIKQKEVKKTKESKIPKPKNSKNSRIPKQK